MKHYLTLLSLIGALTMGSALAASPSSDELNDPNLPGLATPNGAIVYEFLTTWFNEDKPGEAFDKYVSRDHYMDHAVYSASTNKPQNFEEEKAAKSRITTPGIHFVFKQMVAQGDLVISHIWVTNPRTKIGNEMIEIEKLRNGKITDHWDIHVPLKADSEVFLGLNR